MPVNSAEQESQDTVPVRPSDLMSKDEYWQQYKNGSDFYGKSGNVIKAPEHYDDLNYKIAKFFGSGAENSFEAAYEAYRTNWENDYNNYLNDLNNYYEDKAVQSARAWEEKMSSSQYSRTFEDLQKAGVNPYMLLSSGSVSPASYGSSAKADYSKRKASSGSSAKSDSNGSRNGRDLALIMLALARLIAAL